MFQQLFAFVRDMTSHFKAVAIEIRTLQEHITAWLIQTEGLPFGANVERVKMNGKKMLALCRLINEVGVATNAVDACLK